MDQVVGDHLGRSSLDLVPFYEMNQLAILE